MFHKLTILLMRFMFPGWLLSLNFIQNYCSPLNIMFIYISIFSIIFFFCSARNSSGKSSLRSKTSVCTGTQSVRCWEDTLKIRSRSVIEQRPAGAGFQHWAVVSPHLHCVTLQSANVMEQSYKDFVQAFSCIDINIYVCVHVYECIHSVYVCILYGYIVHRAQMLS